MKYQIKVTPRGERKAVVAQALEASEDKERLDDFRGQPVDLKVVILSIELPVYRMANCRTFSEQQNSIVESGRDPLFFESGQESGEAQGEQHRILTKITKNAKASIANIYEVLESEGQREAILITSAGVVVNGNRRLSAIRDMYAQDPIEHKKFSHVKCAVLPSDATSDDIDDLEATLQARPQTKLDYDWIGEARLIRRQIDKGRTHGQVAEQLRRKPAEISNALKALTEAELYLTTWVNKPGQYSLVSEDGEQLFNDIPKQTTSQDAQLQRASRAIAWSVFENAERFTGRIYSYNAAFGKLAPKVIDAVSKKLGLQYGKDEGTESDQFDIAIDEDDQVSDYSAFIDALRNEGTKKEAVGALVEACDTALESDRGKRQKDAALKAFSQVHSKLEAINTDSAGPNTYQPMLNQIKAIEKKLLKHKGKITKLKEKTDKAKKTTTSQKGKTGDRK